MQIIRLLQTLGGSRSERQEKNRAVGTPFLRAPRALAFVLCLCACLASTCLARTSLELLFDDIQAGMELDLADETQREVLLYYVLSRDPCVDYPDRLRLQIHRMRSALKELEIPRPQPWSGRFVPAVEGRPAFRVRPMGFFEAPLRGHWGGDCSSDTRLLRAWQPGHRNFALESEDGTSMGQMELVLGEAERPVAFLERFHRRGPVRNLITLQTELALQLFAAIDIAAEHGYELRIPEAAFNSIAIYDELGHPIANLRVARVMLERALKKFFRPGPTIPGFCAHPDAFASPLVEMYANIAKEVSVRRQPLVSAIARADLVEKSRGIRRETPRISGARHDFAALLAELKRTVGPRVRANPSVSRNLVLAQEEYDAGGDCPPRLILPAWLQDL